MEISFLPAISSSSSYREEWPPPCIHPGGDISRGGSGGGGWHSEALSHDPSLPSRGHSFLQ